MGSETIFLGSLAFAKPLAEAVFPTMDLDLVMGWLTSTTSDLKEVQPVDPANTDRRVLLILASLEGLYGHTSFYADQRVGMAIVYKPPYVHPISFASAHDTLNYWRSTSGRLTNAACLFLEVFSESGAGPFSDPYPLWFDYDTDSKRQVVNTVFDPCCFRVFRLHRALVTSTKFPDGVSECVCTPEVRDILNTSGSALRKGLFPEQRMWS